MEEIWKDVIGYEGLYQISNLGNVKSYTRYVNVSHRGYSGKRILHGKQLKPTDLQGYLVVMLIKEHKYHTCRINRLVAQAFISNPDNLPCVNHKDENKHNNCVDNLEWCTRNYNDNYGTRNQKISKTRKGMKFSEEHKQNLSISHKNNVTEEFREKMRNIHLGTRLSKEHKQKISQSLKKHYN